MTTPATTQLVLDITRTELAPILTPDMLDPCMQRIEQSLGRRCSHRMSKGVRSGSTCDRRCPGKFYCRTHTPLTAEQECAYVIQSGKNRNQVCKRKAVDDQLCTRHRKVAKRPPRKQPEPQPERVEPVPEAIVVADPEPDTEAYCTEPPTEPYEPQPDPEPDTEPYEPQPEDSADFRPVYSAELQARLKDPNVPRRVPVPEEGSDDDAEIDASDLTEMYPESRSWGCQYWIEAMRFFCMEPTVVNDQFCDKHKRNINKVPYKLGPHNYPMLEIDPVYFKLHNLSGQYWYPRLLLAAKPTPNGMVVIGRLRGQRWIQQLTRREIKRCHNNGLLYKVLPQEVLHYNYHIPDIDQVPGQGFTDFEQIRFDRPRLYIKYWNIWNRHIEQRQAFFRQYRKETDPHKWRKAHTCPLPNWTEFETEYRIHGLSNPIVPAPSVDDIADPAFDAWAHCARVHPDAFPPFYLDYPDPYAMRTPSTRVVWEEEPVNAHTPRRVRHYHYPPDKWIEEITTKGKEWVQIYC